MKLVACMRNGRGESQSLGADVRGTVDKEIKGGLVNNPGAPEKQVIITYDNKLKINYTQPPAALGTGSQVDENLAT